MKEAGMGTPAAHGHLPDSPHPLRCARGTRGTPIECTQPED